MFNFLKKKRKKVIVTKESPVDESNTYVLPGYQIGDRSVGEPDDLKCELVFDMGESVEFMEVLGLAENSRTDHNVKIHFKSGKHRIAVFDPNKIVQGFVYSKSSFKSKVYVRTEK